MKKRGLVFGRPAFQKHETNSSRLIRRSASHSIEADNCAVREISDRRVSHRGSSLPLLILETRSLEMDGRWLGG